MAGSAGPTVKLTFAGDSSQLDKTLQSVGDNAETMGRKVGDSSDKVRSVGTAFDGAGERADNAEGRFQGVSDVTSGLIDGFQGLTDGSLTMGERLQMLGGAGADLAGGFAYLLPFLGTMISSLWGMVTATWSWTAALLANPITWIVIGVIALIAALYALIFHFDWVKSVATNVVNWIGDRMSWVGNVASNVAGWIRDRFVDAFNWVRNIAGGVFDWFGSLPGRIGGIFSSIGDGIKNVFRSAFNFVADIWNNTIGRISITIPGWVPGIGGNSFSAPKIPKFHDGGVVPGAPGQEVLALLQAGETVTPAGAGSGSGVIIIKGDGSATGQFLAELLSRHIRGQGGNVQEVLGT